MVVGEVFEVVGGEGEESLEFGLVYVDWKYREVGDVIFGK